MFAIRNPEAKVNPNRRKRNQISDVDLDFYSDVPNYELSLDEFEEMALARLKVLRKIEELKSRNIRGDPYRLAMDSTIKNNIQPNRQATNINVGKKKVRSYIDVVSHFILRAAYCRTEELRRWFLTQECHLFRHRLDKVANSSSRELHEFLNQSGIQFNRVPDNEKKELREFLLSIPDGNKTISPTEFATTAYFKIPFIQSLDLIQSRQVYLQNGFAYVPTSRFVSIVTARFRMHLSKSLVHASNAFAHISESERIGPLLKSMNQQYIGNDFNNTNHSLTDGTVTDATIGSFVDRSMPLCMRQLHKGMERDKKLKYFGRQQYGLFLKGAGLSVEESLRFFQRSFSQFSPEQFEKQYAYNIRHMYGKEGKRANYSPYTCTKIIMGQQAPQSGDHHGCPYRHYDESSLESLLSSLHIGVSDRDAIMTLKKTKNYQLACARHFEAVHPSALEKEGVNMEGVGNHPNAWFGASMSYFESIGDNKNEKLKIKNESLQMEE